MGTLRSRTAIAAFLVAAAAAGAAPLIDRKGHPASSAAITFPGWPTSYEGRKLTALALTERESVFANDFPGRVGRFWDGKRAIIMRWVVAPTRRLHSAADCLRGSGYSIAPLPASRDASGAAMGCFRANLRAQTMVVCEVIRDEQGESWPDVSAWYWHAVFGASPAPWWSIVLAESGS
jgi:hypothetical protein